MTDDVQPKRGRNHFGPWQRVRTTPFEAWERQGVYMGKEAQLLVYRLNPEHGWTYAFPDGLTGVGGVYPLWNAMDAADKHALRAEATLDGGIPTSVLQQRLASLPSEAPLPKRPPVLSLVPSIAPATPVAPASEPDTDRSDELWEVRRYDDLKLVARMRWLAPHDTTVEYEVSTRIEHGAFEDGDVLFVSGEIRDDGCSENYFGSLRSDVGNHNCLHACQRSDLTRIGPLFEYLFDWACEWMPTGVDILA